MITLRVLKGARTHELDRAKRQLSARLSVCWEEELTAGVILDSLWLANLGKHRVQKNLEMLASGCRARAGRLEARIAGTLDKGMRVKPVVPHVPLLQLPPTRAEVVQQVADRLRRLTFYYEQYARLARAEDDPASCGMLCQNSEDAQRSIVRLDQLTFA